jgi:hypothetical protein
MYPRDLTVDTSIGHYMQFYINVPNTTKYLYHDPEGQLVGGKKISTATEDVYFGKDHKGNPTKVASVGQDFISDGSTAQHGFEELHNPEISGGSGGMDTSDQVLLFKNKRKRTYGLFATYQPTTRIAHSVSIYMPPSIQDNTTMSYNTHETGLLGYMAAAGHKAHGAFTSKDWERLAEIGLGTTLGALTEAAKTLGLGLAEGVTSAEGGYELLNKVYGRSQNPYMEVLFNAPELRSFSYSFTFAPRNKEETADVQNIIKLFRFHMSPELRNDHNMFLTLPSEFDIYYMYIGSDGTVKENPYVNKISTCVLESCAVDYTPNGVKAHPDGSPVIIKMTLGFKEMDMITKDSVVDGY